MRRRSGEFLMAGAAAMMMLCGTAVAQDQQSRPYQQPRASDAASNAAQPQVAAKAPNARIAALIRPGGIIVVGKGISSVTNPAKGIYCIAPSSAGVDPNTSLVTVSVEYFYSKLNEVKVQWARAGHPCGAANLAVYTFADPSATGLYNFSNAVAFVINVP
jgi:hypothetical protein